MKKAIAIMAATSALAYGAGCSPSGGEGQPTPVTANQQLMAERQPFAASMWQEGMKDFVSKLDTKQATLKYTAGDCAYFEEPEGSVLVKNPGTYFYEKPDAHIEFFVYGQGSKTNNELYNGPYVYLDSTLGKTAIADGGTVPVFMGGGSGRQATVNVTGVNADNTTFWFDGADGSRIDQTVIVEHLASGRIDADKVNKASATLCGIALGLVPDEVPPASDSAHQPFTS